MENMSAVKNVHYAQFTFLFAVKAGHTIKLEKKKSLGDISWIKPNLLPPFFFGVNTFCISYHNSLIHHNKLNIMQSVPLIISF